MTKRLEGRVALITGGGGEIGAAIAARFVQEGAKVAVADVVRAQADKIAALLREEGGQTLALETDVSQPDSAADAVRRTIETFGTLGILVNVAAAASVDGNAETIALEDWNRTFAVNLNGAFLMSKHAVPEMRKAGGGAIINIASQLGQLGVPGRSPYCTSKAALIFFTRMLAMDYAKDNIRANTISPGAISTERSSQRYGGKAAAAKVHGPKHLLNRPGRVDEVAAAAAYLASDDASFVTATDLLVDGGYVVFKGTVGADGAPTM